MKLWRRRYQPPVSPARAYAIYRWNVQHRYAPHATHTLCGIWLEGLTQDCRSDYVEVCADCAKASR